MPIRGLRFGRLTPALASVIAAVLILAGIGISIWFDQGYQAQKIDEISAQARILAATVTAALTFNDRNAAQEYVGALRANPEIAVAAVYDNGGALFAGYSDTPGGPPQRIEPAAATHAENGQLVVIAPVRQGTQSLGTVYIRTFVDPVVARVARYAVIAAFVLLAVLVVIILTLAQAALARANAELSNRATELAAANASLQTQIVEREKAEEALRQSQKMEAIGQLTGGVAHDFNNLMHVIIGNLEALRRRTSDRHPELVPSVDAAMRGATRAATLTQQLLAFARRQPLEPKPVDVNRLVAGMSDLLHRTLGETVSTETVLAGGLWRVNADANRLENALLNLALNARDAMPNSGKLTIETSNMYLDDDYAKSNEEVKVGQYVMIAVTDTGTGMTKETMEKAFDPFYTTKEVGKGSGLGLSQVYGFLKQSGGHAKIYSELGQGTTVRLYLPRLVSDAAESGVADDSATLPGGDKAEIVLVVEDDDDVRAFTVAVVEELGYTVIEAHDAKSAMSVIDTAQPIGLLFTDVGLPGGVNGKQLADRALVRRPSLKVLFSTGYARNAIVHQGRLDPGVELITKPFTHAALAAKIRHVLEAGPAP
ncbi:MAG TPA: ATP-binding protein [Stellaceae bacterium]|nr:ATP-binding protein [Stellaceae bacterium]